ncbi:DUF6124 family protein [Pseudomonas sp. GB2N2]
MKKTTPIAIAPSGLPAGKTADQSQPVKVSEQYVSVPLRTHTRLDPPSQFFAVVPDVDTAAMLCHASENLASLNIMATDLARELEGPRRQVILTIQQLSALAELLVNRALDILEPPRGSSTKPTNCPR